MPAAPNNGNGPNETAPPARIAGAISLVSPFSGLPTDRYRIQDFISNIEEAALLDGWSDTQKCAITRLRLQPPAKDFLETDTSLPTTTSWTSLREALMTRFVVSEPYAQAYKLLTDCFQKQNESVQDYASRLRILGNKTLRLGTDPTENSVRRKVLQEHLLLQFCKGLQDSLKRFVATHDPSSLDDALSIAQREETFTASQQLVPAMATLATSDRPSRSRDRYNYNNDRRNYSNERRSYSKDQRSNSTDRNRDSSRNRDATRRDRSNSSGPNNRSPTPYPQQRNRTPIRSDQCSYCKGSNHWKEHCRLRLRQADNRKYPNAN